MRCVALSLGGVPGLVEHDGAGVGDQHHEIDVERALDQHGGRAKPAALALLTVAVAGCAKKAPPELPPPPPTDWASRPRLSMPEVSMRPV